MGLKNNVIDAYACHYVYQIVNRYFFHLQLSEKCIFKLNFISDKELYDEISQQREFERDPKYAV